MPSTRPFQTFPDPSYLETVLKPNFDHSVRHFFRPLIEINQAHAIMLTRCGIISERHGRRVLKALKQVSREQEQLLSYCYRGGEEDLFFHVENRLATLCGEEVAGHLSVARSRNDVDMTLYRMVLREEIIESSLKISSLQRTLLELAGRHLHTVFPVVTHTQLAQPTTLAHYLMAVAGFLRRDLDRFFSAYFRVDECPLGACVATTTGFPIDRSLLARLLGFPTVIGNAYDCIASVDYLVESAGVVSTLMINLGKFIEDLLDWSSHDSQLIYLSDGFVQSSSIMPQKRNPVALEHLRILASCALGQAHAILTGLHNTPFGDIVDAEDDIQPIVRNTFQYAARVVVLLTNVLKSMTIDEERALSLCRTSGVTLTELADWLVAQYQLPFRSAHRVVSQVASRLRQQPSRRSGEPWIEAVCELTAKFSRQFLGKEIRIFPKEMSHILDPVRFVAVRQVLGGPAPKTVERTIRSCLKWNSGRQHWLMEKQAQLKSYQKNLDKL
jgi:argininosuccinate lyase